MDYQLYQIALSPDLGITSEEFATAWNEIPEYRSITEARFSQAKETQYDATLVAGILISIATNVASSAFYDLIKDVIRRLQDKKGAQSIQGKPTHVHIEETSKPDGTHILVVDVDEG